MNKDISYEKLIKRYCLDPEDVLIITNGVLNNSTLHDIQGEINGKLTKEKIYVIARALCQNLVGEDIALVAPVMSKERREMADKVAKKKSLASSGSESDDKSAQSAEEVMNILSELFYEHRD